MTEDTCANSAHKIRSVLFRPFLYLTGKSSLLLGLVIIIVTGIICSLGRTHFDGVLDVHTGPDLQWWLFVLEGIIDWLIMGILLLAGGKIISREHFSPIDVLGHQALARWPMFFVSIVLLLPGYQRFATELIRKIAQGQLPLPFQMGTSSDLLAFAFAIIVVLVVIIWVVALMYRGFALSCRVQGGRAIGTFIGCLVAGEILSKLAIVGLMRWTR
jgi:hypothetical protein